MDKNRLLWFNNVIFSFVYKWLIYKYLNAIKAIYMFNKLIMFVGSVYNRYNKDKRGYKDVCMWFISVVCGLINALIRCKG